MGREYKPPTYTEDFLAWWESVERKESKADAFKAWEQTDPVRPPLEEMVSSMRAKIAEWDREERAPKMRPLPATMLRDHYWEDEVKPFVEQRPDWQRIGDVNFGADHDGAWDRRMPEALRRIAEDRDNWGLDDEAIEAVLELKAPLGDWKVWYGELDKIHLLHCRRRWKTIPKDEQEVMEKKAQRLSGGEFARQTYAEILVMLTEVRFDIPPLAPWAISYGREMR